MTKLTDKDKLVFYSLVRWPSLNDIELSEKTGIKRSTITAIRNKLEKNKLYTTIKFPDLERIGCEILTVRYGSFNPIAPYSIREKYSTLSSSTHRFPEVVFKRSTDRHRVALHAATNFTDVKRYIDYSNKIYGEHGFLTDEGIIHVFFPFKLSKVFRFFDYAPLLRQCFKLQVKEEKIALDTEFHEKERLDLTEKEKQVLYALVKYPELNDNQIAEKVSMTRQSVSTIRKKLEGDDLIRTIRIPDLGAIGIQLLVFTHILVNPKSTLSDRKHLIQEMLQQGCHIFYISGNLEFVLISAFVDYPEYNSVFEEIVNYYKEHDMLLKDPVTRIFLNKDIKFCIDGRFAPLVKKVLGLKTEV